MHGPSPGAHGSRPRRATADGPAVARLVAPVALLFPRVAAVVVAVGLPEAGLVVVEELDAAHPLGALPEVEMRHQQARRPAVLGLERLVAVAVCDPRLAAGHVGDRQV